MHARNSDTAAGQAQRVGAGDRSGAIGQRRCSSNPDWGPFPRGGASSTAASDAGFGLTELAVALWPAAVAVDLVPPGTSGERKRICSEGGERSTKTIRRCEELASQKWLPLSMLNHIFWEHSGNLAIPILSRSLNQTTSNHFFSGYL
jgi:hypothetical protein